MPIPEINNIRDEILTGPFADYAAVCLVIRTKDKGIQPFILNDAQRFLDFRLEDQKAKTGRIRAIILKGRQEGVSTLIEGRFIRHTTSVQGVRAFILTHAQDATENLFEMAERFYEHLPPQVKPISGVSNAKELTFSRLDSGYRIGTAGNKAVGRSQTIQLFHGSEVGFWPNAEEHTKGVFQAVPDADNTEIILESTANGVNNFFHHIWKDAESGRSEFQAIFLPWFWMQEYQKEPPDYFEPSQEEIELAQQYELNLNQIYWRRLKIIELDSGDDVSSGEIAFKQEYPMNPAEAFQFSGGDTLIKAPECMAARKREVRGAGRLYVGIDPSYGGDRFALVRRQGSKMYNPETYTGSDVASFHQRLSICYRAATQFDAVAGRIPDVVCIDFAVGKDIVDELMRMGCKNVRAINFGEAPKNKEKYANKRNEIYGLLAAWLNDEMLPPQIPDDDEFQADLCATPFRYDHYERKLLREKAVIKKDFGFSPDLADAAALTFAVLIAPQLDHVRPSPITPQNPSNRRNRVSGQGHGHIINAKDLSVREGRPSQRRGPPVIHVEPITPRGKQPRNKD